MMTELDTGASILGCSWYGYAVRMAELLIVADAFDCLLELS
ncbi:hypothetical protein O5623_17535 [Escherichia coli]|nr:hypothetical protein [Escherichia coli]